MKIILIISVLISLVIFLPFTYFVFMLAEMIIFGFFFEADIWSEGFPDITMFENIQLYEDLLRPIILVFMVFILYYFVYLIFKKFSERKTF